MKKVIIGAVMFMTGVVSAFILWAERWPFNLNTSTLSPFSMTMQILAQYGLTAFLYAAAALAAAGIVVAVLGLKET